jgi:phage terminase large subunit
MGREVRIGAASEVFDDFMRPSRYKALHGGRGSAKSHFFAEVMVANAAANKGFRAVCVREVQKSLKESAKRLLEDKIAALGFGADFEVLTDSIKTPGGGVIIFQGMQDHTAESIKSLEGFNVAWVEEAQTMSSRSLEMLRPTIRAPGSELWFSWNPRNASDPVDKFFRGAKPPENAIIRRINYDQNRFFPDELEDERRHDYRNSPDRYGHIWLGEYEPMAIGAIWTRQTLHETRRSEHPTLNRMLVSELVVTEDGSEAVGLVVGGMGPTSIVMPILPLLATMGLEIVGSHHA